MSFYLLVFIHSFRDQRIWIAHIWLHAWKEILCDRQEQASMLIRKWIIAVYVYMGKADVYRHNMCLSMYRSNWLGVCVCVCVHSVDIEFFTIYSHIYLNTDFMLLNLGSYLSLVTSFRRPRIHSHTMNSYDIHSAHIYSVWAFRMKLENVSTLTVNIHKLCKYLWCFAWSFLVEAFSKEPPSKTFLVVCVLLATLQRTYTLLCVFCIVLSFFISILLPFLLLHPLLSSTTLSAAFVFLSHRILNHVNTPLLWPSYVVLLLRIRRCSCYYLHRVRKVFQSHSWPYVLTYRFIGCFARVPIITKLCISTIVAYPEICWNSHCIICFKEEMFLYDYKVLHVHIFVNPVHVIQCFH